MINMNNTVAILIMVSLVVTVIGTWAVLEQIDSNNNMPAKTITGASENAKVTMTILAPTSIQQSDTGKVLLNIQ